VVVEVEKLVEVLEEMEDLVVEHLVQIQLVKEMVILLQQVHHKVIQEALPQDHPLKQVLVVEVL
tara:strand:+ start:231 stop:422 length:192 start_codon:yes stop_codon:yes gene_type:complete